MIKKLLGAEVEDADVSKLKLFHLVSEQPT